MKNVCIDKSGDLRCYNCGSKGFTEKRTLRSKVIIGVGSLLTKKKLKCQVCGEYNDTGNADEYKGPASKKYTKMYEAELALLSKVSGPSVSINKVGDLTDSVLEKLSRLGQLRDTGVVTTEEFEKLKSDVLTGESSNVSLVTSGVISDALAAEADKSEFTVWLIVAGAQKIAVIKAVRELTNLGLRGAKDLVDGAPMPVLKGVSEYDANLARVKLGSVGALVEIR